MQLLVRPSILLYALAPLLADTLSLDTSSPGMAHSCQTRIEGVD